MAKITVAKEKCKGCILCISFCPKGLIKKSKQLNKRGLNYVEFSRQSNLKEGGIPPSVIAESRRKREEAGKGDSECLGCALCAIICPDCCIEVYK